MENGSSIILEFFSSKRVAAKFYDSLLAASEKQKNGEPETTPFGYEII